ncbi:hypothetical protein [Marseilla massiliensis]|uniref:hypothetical protein n=1 Tax=Marseilla massiliensis TaxID=1841864 RepID=UPI0030C7BAC8
MKRRLLMMMAAIAGLATPSFAYQQGDAVYTFNGKFKIIGENMLTNGDFSDGVNGWTGLTGNAVPTDTFSVVPAGGPDGMNCLQVSMSGGTLGTNLHNSANFRQSVRLTPGNYVFTYKVKALTGGCTSNTRSSGRNDNYQDVFLNNSGKSPYLSTNEADNITSSVAAYVETEAGNWMTVSYNYRVEADEYVNFEFFNLIQYDCFADFGVYPVEQVGDDRLLQDAVNTLEAFVADETNFPGAADYLAGPIEDLKASMENPDLTVDDVNGMVSMILGSDGSALQEYLNTISADVSKYFNYFTFDDCAEKSANKGAADGWTESGGRWGVSAPWSDFTTRHIFADINGGYGLGAGSQYQSAFLPKGKYLYMVQASAYQYYTAAKETYIVDWYNQRSGLKYFINADSIDMTDVPTWKSNTYFHVFDVANDGEQTLGFYRAANEAASGNDRNRVSGGGRVRFDNMHIRILGVTDEDVERFFLENNLADAQNSLKTMIDSAKTVIADSRYIWGKDVLQDSINVSQGIYDQYTNAVQEDIDKLNDQMPLMRDAIRDYYAINKEYTQLGDDIAAANKLTGDETRPNGKDELRAAITTADKYYKSLNSQSERDSLQLVKTDSLLNDAVGDFYLANASYQTPGYINLVNDDFTDGTNGWSVDNGTGTAAWKASDVDMPTYKGRAVVFNRGVTASDNKYIVKDVYIKKTGIYEFSATCAVHSSSWSEIGENQTYTYLIAGADSVNVITKGDGSKKQQIGEWDRFVVQTNIENVETSEGLVAPHYLRVGLVKIPKEDGTNQSVNIICFGSPVLVYYGTKEEYESGISDVEVVDTTFDVYNLNGMKVRSNATSLDGLAKGIYIVDGKKYVVK